VSEEQLLALPRYHESDAFDALERLVLDYAVAMTRTPPEVSDGLFAALRGHFDERQMVELTNVIALENLRSRFNSALDMTPAGFSEGMVCIVPEPAAAPATLTHA
jgi:alkylhydroperoxidase family enzyme